jgi:ribosome-associated protein
MSEPLDREDLEPSKSEKKREMKALQGLAERLGGLSEAVLSGLGLGAASRVVLLQIGRMKASGARNRQIKYAAQRLLGEDLAPVHAWFEEAKARSAAERQRFHALERWRDRLVEEGDEALEELLVDHPGLDRQRLRQLIRAARREAAEERAPAAARKLFRFLRDQTTE